MNFDEYLLNYTCFDKNITFMGKIKTYWNFIFNVKNKNVIVSKKDVIPLFLFVVNGNQEREYGEHRTYAGHTGPSPYVPTTACKESA